jgi:hypothetical protein
MIMMLMLKRNCTCEKETRYLGNVSSFIVLPGCQMKMYCFAVWGSWIEDILINCLCMLVDNLPHYAIATVQVAECHDFRLAWKEDMKKIIHKKIQE